MKYTKHFLKKVEELFKEIQYIIRYEKGSFQSGYCIVEDRKIAVINRFFDTEARINSLIEILGVIDIKEENLTEKSAALFKQLSKKREELEAETEGKVETEAKVEEEAETKVEAEAEPEIETKVEAETEKTQ